jgi:hypothetical protein
MPYPLMVGSFLPSGTREIAKIVMTSARLCCTLPLGTCRDRRPVPENELNWPGLAIAVWANRGFGRSPRF